MAEVQAEGDGGTPLEPPDADDDKEKYVETDPSERYGRVSLLLVTHTAPYSHCSSCLSKDLELLVDSADSPVALGLCPHSELDYRIACEAM